MSELASPPKGLGFKEEGWLTPNLLLYSRDRASFQGLFAVGPAVSGHRPSAPGCPARRPEATVLQRGVPFAGHHAPLCSLPPRSGHLPCSGQVQVWAYHRHALLEHTLPRLMHFLKIRVPFSLRWILSQLCSLVCLEFFFHFNLTEVHMHVNRRYTVVCAVMTHCRGDLI